MMTRPKYPTKDIIQFVAQRQRYNQRVARKAKIEEHFKDAVNWVCECGQICNPMGADWRWNGNQWEHCHGYPIGHVPAQRKNQGNPICKVK